MEQPDLGKRIAILRKAKGLTQEELAMKCNVSARTLQRIEAGVVIPRAYTIKAVLYALDYNADGFLKNIPEKRLYPVYRSYFECIYKYFIDLFNLKTNTMKKVSVLSVMALVFGFGLFMLCFESRAQDINVKYVEMGGREITYLYPSKLKNVSVNNMKDTADYRLGAYFIQEYKKNIFLDGKFVERVDEGDTVILNTGTMFKKATITVKKASYAMLSLNGGGIVYIFPKGKSLSISNTSGKGTNYSIGQFKIREFENKIFLDDVYQGDAFANDSVILRKNGTLIIKNNKQK